MILALEANNDGNGKRNSKYCKSLLRSYEIMKGFIELFLFFHSCLTISNIRSHTHNMYGVSDFNTFYELTCYCNILYISQPPWGSLGWNVIIQIFEIKIMYSIHVFVSQLHSKLSAQTAVEYIQHLYSMVVFLQPVEGG